MAERPTHLDEHGRARMVDVSGKVSSERVAVASGAVHMSAEAFALVREAARRTVGQRHYDVQLVGGMVLHEGKIGELKTGEGKTLTATLPLYLNALEGRGAHLVTVNDYLAKRDAQWYGPVFDTLGLTVGVLQHDAAFMYAREQQSETQNMEHLAQSTRREAYRADITYGTNSWFVP